MLSLTAIDSQVALHLALSLLVYLYMDDKMGSNNKRLSYIPIVFFVDTNIK